MNVTMMLADSAQSVRGKLYILGGGWSITNSTTPPMAIAIKIEVPWTESNIRHKLRLELVDQDDRLIRIDDKPVVIYSQFEAGRPPGIMHGVPLDVTLAINLAPIPLEPESRYSWRCYINDCEEPAAKVGFSTRQAKRTNAS